MGFMTNKTNIEWTKPELLQDADTWAAYQTAMALWSERSPRTLRADGIVLMCQDAIAFLSSGKAPSHVADRWLPAYRRVIAALGM